MLFENDLLRGYGLRNVTPDKDSLQVYLNRHVVPPGFHDLLLFVVGRSAFSPVLLHGDTISCLLLLANAFIVPHDGLCQCYSPVPII